MARYLLIALLAVLPLVGRAATPAQYTDQVLYHAYETGKLAPWRAYVDQESARWEQLSEAERLRLVSYEYGWVASAIDSSKVEGQHYLDLFEAHVAELGEAIPESKRFCYESSIAAYHFLLNKAKIASGLTAKKLAERAYEVGPFDPLALTLYGSILFEAPRIIGGDKPEARRLFLRADSIYNVEPWPWNWQRISLNVFLDKSKNVK